MCHALCFETLCLSVAALGGEALRSNSAVCGEVILSRAFLFLPFAGRPGACCRRTRLVCDKFRSEFWIQQGSPADGELRGFDVSARGRRKRAQINQRHRPSRFRDRSLPRRNLLGLVRCRRHTGVQVMVPGRMPNVRMSPTEEAPLIEELVDTPIAPETSTRVF